MVMQVDWQKNTAYACVHKLEFLSCQYLFGFDDIGSGLRIIQIGAGVGRDVPLTPPRAAHTGCAPTERGD